MFLLSLRFIRKKNSASDMEQAQQDENRAIPGRLDSQSVRFRSRCVDEDGQDHGDKSVWRLSLRPLLVNRTQNWTQNVLNLLSFLLVMNNFSQSISGCLIKCLIRIGLSHAGNRGSNPLGDAKRF